MDQFIQILKKNDFFTKNSLPKVAQETTGKHGLLSQEHKLLKKVRRGKEFPE